MAISKFKATCLAALEKVHRTGHPLLVTRRGEPIAQVIPASPPAKASGSFGAMQGKMRTVGNIVEPLEEEDWEVLSGPDGN